jgi:uncharacterized DUF497 family protein
MFSWDPQKAPRNYRKHHVSFEEGTIVFDDTSALEVEDVETQVDSDRRWKRLGYSDRNRILLIVYTIRRLDNGTETIRIISARQATAAERDLYAGR